MGLFFIMELEAINMTNLMKYFEAFSDEFGIEKFREISSEHSSEGLNAVLWKKVVNKFVESARKITEETALLQTIESLTQRFNTFERTYGELEELIGRKKSHRVLTMFAGIYYMQKNKEKILFLAFFI